MFKRIIVPMAAGAAIGYVIAKQHFELKQFRCDHPSCYSPRFPFDWNFVKKSIFANREHAEKILDNLRDIKETYGLVSIKDYYDLVGMYANYLDEIRGWLTLKNAEIHGTESEGFWINFPTPRWFINSRYTRI